MYLLSKEEEKKLLNVLFKAFQVLMRHLSRGKTEKKKTSQNLKYLKREIDNFYDGISLSEQKFLFFPWNLKTISIRILRKSKYFRVENHLELEKAETLSPCKMIIIRN
jgi:hypothetical protein